MDFQTFFGKQMDMDKLTASIKAHEGFRAYPYQDTTGHSTIGYGRNLTDRGITKPEAELMLQDDIQLALSQAIGESWWSHVSGNDARSRAMTEMVFNMGLPKLREFHVATLCLCNDDFEGASRAFMDSLWAQQVKGRAKTLTQMIATGEDVG